jgi:asparagine synthetase B (glutamine-hydrolysing)
MIKHPKNWQDIGRKVSPQEVAEAVQDCILTLNIRNLSLSGGIDSTLLLYFMKTLLGDPIHCYTIALDETHPDYIHAKMATVFFGVEFHPYVLGKPSNGNESVRTFYERLSADGVKDIIAGDGIDEFACGYYSHEKDGSEQNYISWIRKLNAEQLVPLNENSGDVSVYLPYLSSEVISLLSLIPLSEKVDSYRRKKIIVEMAQGNIPDVIVNRWKFGFCDAGSRKDLK